jgi:TonB family protein
MSDTVDHSGIAGQSGTVSGERRAQPRTEVLQTSAGIVAVELDQGDSGIILDLTSDGMMVQCLSPLIAGDTRTVSFVLPGTSAPLNLAAVVVWSDPEGRAGLRFNPSRDGSRKELQAWLNDSRRSVFNFSSPFAPSLIPESRPEPTAPSLASVPESSAHSAPPQDLSFRDALTSRDDVPDEHQRSVNAMAWTIVEEISRLTPAQGAVVAIRQGDAITCRASWGSAPGVGARLQPKVGLSGECFRTGQAILCNDADADERVPSSVSKRLNLKSILVVPVHGTSGSLGLLEAIACEKNAFSDSHVRILTRLAASLAEVLRSGGGEDEIVNPPPAPVPSRHVPVPVTAPPAASPGATRTNGTSPASDMGSRNGAKPAESHAPKPMQPQAEKTALGTSSPASSPPKALARPAPGRPASADGTPSRPASSSLQSGSAAPVAAPRRAPGNKRPAPPAKQAPQQVRKQEEDVVLPLAGALQVSGAQGPLNKSSSTLPTLSRARGTSGLGLGSATTDAAPDHTFAVAGIAGIIILAIVAAFWTLNHRQPSPATQSAPQVIPSQQVTEPVKPADAPSQSPPDATSPANSPARVIPSPAAAKTREPSLPLPAVPRSTPTRTRASEPPEQNVVVYPVEEDIRRPAAVSKPLVASVTPVQPPVAVAGGTAAAAGLSLPTDQAAPRLAAPPPPTAPQVIRRVDPRRPQSARSLSGTVVLSATIGIDGRPSDIKAVRGNPLLVSAALAAFRNWQYEPAQRNGTPTTAPVEVRFVFAPE